MAPPASVAQLLNGAQDSAAACARCAGALWKALLAEPDVTFEALADCVDHLLTITQVRWL